MHKVVLFATYRKNYPPPYIPQYKICAGAGGNTTSTQPGRAEKKTPPVPYLHRKFRMDRDYPQTYLE